MLISDMHKKMDRFFEKLDTSNPQECKEEIMKYIPPLIYKYQQLCATGSSIAFQSFVNSNNISLVAKPYLAYSLKEIERKVELECRFLFGEIDEV